MCVVCSTVVHKPNRKYCDLCWEEAMCARRGTPRRTDANQQEIVDALRKVGCTVYDISETGGGVPDLLVRRPNGELVLIEVKNPKAKGKLNKLQVEWHRQWAGCVFVAHTIEEALAVAGIR